MKYYEFAAGDQVCNNWLIFFKQREEPYLCLKPRYKNYVCSKCGKFKHDEIFEDGFDTTVKIRGRGDIIETDDGFHCINETVRKIIESENCGGFKLKSLGTSGWYVLNTTFRVKADAGAYQLYKPFCSRCKRPAEVTGLIDYLSQISIPNRTKTFFSTVFDRSCSSFYDRPLFVTEEIVALLKGAGIKSGKNGMFRKLLNSEEEAQLRKSIGKGKAVWPASSHIVL